MVQETGWASKRATADGSGARGVDDGTCDNVDAGSHDDGDRFEVSDDALDAHRQVLEMSATIEILTRDFENLQRELLDAYKKLQEYSALDPRLHGRGSPSKFASTPSGGVVSNAMAKLRTGNYSGCCDHEVQVLELQRMIAVKDTALTEALYERNEYKVQLEKAESLIKELSPVPGGSGVSGRTKLTQSSRTASFSCYPTSTSPVGGTTMLNTSPGASKKDVPKRDRFDQESSYQAKEGDELFWRKQYRDAVRMRKKPGSAGTSQANGGSGPRPSLKIFSYPNSHRQKGITDENVPFSRYIGISTRQNEIIKEQHRILS